MRAGADRGTVRAGLTPPPAAAATPLLPADPPADPPAERLPLGSAPPGALLLLYPPFAARVQGRP